MKKAGKPSDNPSPELRKLKKLAEIKGILTEYKSAFGGVVQSEPDALVAILRSLGTEVNPDLSNLDLILAQESERKVLHFSEPVAISWEGKGLAVPIRLPEPDSNASGRLTISLEGGGSSEMSLNLATLPAKRNFENSHGRFVEKTLVIKNRLPLGYHSLRIEVAGRNHIVMVIAAPKKAWTDETQPRGRRLLGMFSPLYSIHSQRSWGIGDFADLEKFIDWSYSLGCDFVGTLPLLSGFLGKPFVEASPYSPVSRTFWNEIFIAPDLEPEFQAARSVIDSPEFSADLEKARAMDLVDYGMVGALKRRVLQPMALDYFGKGGERTEGFQKFIAVQPRAREYAAFRAVCDRTGLPWREWPERMREGNIERGDYDEADFQYHLYVQWLAHKQLTSLSEKSRGRGLGLYLDFPLSVNADGYDVWKERDSFGHGVAAGAPPDPQTTSGQDWGILPLHPENSRRTGYRYFRACIENQMRYAGLMRLDHVMSLLRLYWVPSGLGAKKGAYVLYNREEMFAIMLLESHRNQCMLIGEDLGTVPPEIRESMEKHEVLRMYVQILSYQADKKQPIKPEPENCVASMSTHDLPPFAAFWKSLDYLDRVDLGFLTRVQYREKKAAREKLLKTVLPHLRATKFLKRTAKDLKSIMAACLCRLAAGNAKAVIVNIEDLWLETKRQNVPATTTERPNWRRKLKFGLDELRAKKDLREIMLLVRLLRDKGSKALQAGRKR